MSASLRSFVWGLAAAMSLAGTASAQRALDQPVFFIKASYSRDYARYYAPYAIQASVAYSGIGRLEEARTQPVSDGYGADVNYAVDYVFDEFRNQKLKERAREAFKAWQYQFGREPFGGPSFQVWARTSSQRTGRDACTEVSIAFRGTLGWRDWVSDFHPITGYFVDTYYYQLKRDIDGIITSIADLDCYKRATVKPKIVSTGHSLGGGLAQFAALANKPGVPRITKVLAFDPSPITAASLVDQSVQSQNSQGLTIDRLYQTGEGASFLRKVLQQYPQSGSRCNPFVRTVRFDAIPEEGLIKLHGMAPLAAQIVQLSYRKGKLLEYQTPPDPDPSKCTLDYYPPATDEDAVASAGGQQKLAALRPRPNYRGYVDQLGPAYAQIQENDLGIKTAGISSRRVALVSGERRKRAPGSHRVVALVEKVAVLSPLPRAD